MFGKTRIEKVQNAATLPSGIAEIIFCIFDEKRRLKHHYQSIRPNGASAGGFKLLNDPAAAFDHILLCEAVSSRKPVSVLFNEGAGRSVFFNVLPYEYKRGRFHFACLQVAIEQQSAQETEPVDSLIALDESRVCLLLADARKAVLAASSVVPEAFGYSSDKLVGQKLSDLFGVADLGRIYSGSADTHESIQNCVFQCQDGSKRDVEVKKYTATDGGMLYVVSDVTRPQLNEEITSVATRERRRIGQDLHDSVGQMLTGISLLGRSLANGLKRAGNAAHEDAAQISDLADDASNQIRQISRGLMPTDIVHRGLHDSLRNLARMTTASCGMKCETAIDDRIVFPDGAIETHLFRIAQEAVNNAVRHSGGSHIYITISEEEGLPQLEVRDNGRWRNIIENEGGIGMRTMQYRATAINGKLNIGQVPGGGTRVLCRLEADDFGEIRVD
ncbi:sensor histidine kinase [Pontiellaceae bacterium B12219]|nr:sensor histidine kinase [Pontiellaceae bacterium B12219]